MMLLTAIVATLAAVALGLMVVFGRLQREIAKSRDWRETEFVALSLSRLMDPVEQQYLRTRVPAQIFRKLQRKRMALAWRYAKHLRLDTAALAATTHAPAPLLIELNEINVELLKIQLIALAGYCCPNHRFTAEGFSERWHRFAEQLRPPNVVAELTSKHAP